MGAGRHQHTDTFFGQFHQRADGLVAGVAGDDFVGIVDINHTALDIGDEDAFPGVGKHTGGQPLLGLRTFTPGDIVECTEDGRFTIVMLTDPRQRQVDVQLAGVIAQAAPLTGLHPWSITACSRARLFSSEGSPSGWNGGDTPARPCTASDSRRW